MDSKERLKFIIQTPMKYQVGFHAKTTDTVLHT